MVLDIETVPDTVLVPPDWPPEKFPKTAWHRITAISFVEAGIRRDEVTGTEAYAFRCCRSGGQPGWDEARLLRTFWRFFESGGYRLVTWNGRSFDVPTLLLRSMMHGIAAPAWFQRGTKWAGYGHRYALDWHADLMEAMADFGASSRLTLDEGAALVGAPGKLGAHGSKVASWIETGEIERVRAYCETDCLNLSILYLRWAFLTGRTCAANHDAAVESLIEYLDAQRARRSHLGAFLDAWMSARSTSPFVGRRRLAVDSDVA
ncbi:3'-5' exonuclease [Methylobacterium soli]|uniref:3'-5' exonuclease n=1 Tax=Methylobacterium soli TaxID=553447 RepID=UPI001EE2F781|nr:3'-5' exonuclease [Methylobacterium soli]